MISEVKLSNSFLQSANCKRLTSGFKIASDIQIFWASMPDPRLADKRQFKICLKNIQWILLFSIHPRVCVFSECRIFAVTWICKALELNNSTVFKLGIPRTIMTHRPHKNAIISWKWGWWFRRYDKLLNSKLGPKQDQSVKMIPKRPTFLILPSYKFCIETNTLLKWL